MRNLKKVLSLTLALVMMLGMMVVGAGAAEYTDAGDIEYKEAAAVLDAIKVIKGRDDGSFDPEAELNRAEGATIIYRMIMGGMEKEPSPVTTGFVDVDGTNFSWASGYIAACAQQGILSGVGDNRFDPAGKLTGYAFAKMLLVALGYDAGSEGFTGNGWEANVFRDAYLRNINVADVNMAANLTREQAAQMALQTLQATMVDQEPGVTVNGVVIPGKKATDRAASAANDYAGRTSGDDKDEKLQFCELYFSELKLKTSDTDGMNRPTQTWTFKGKTVTSSPSAAAWKMVVDKDKAGKTVANIINDHNSNWKTSSYTEGTSTAAIEVVSINGADRIAANNDSAKLKIGDVVEVYMKDSTQVATVAVTRYEAGSLTADVVTKGEGDNLQVRVPGVVSSLTAASKVEGYAGLAKGDVVYYYKDKDDVYHIALADSFEGTLTGTKGTGFIINGETHYINGNVGTITAVNGTNEGDVKYNTNYEYFTDANGYLIAAKAVGQAETSTEYVVIDKIVYVAGNGSINSSNYVEARLVKMDGTTEVKTISSVTLNDSTAASGTTKYVDVKTEGATADTEVDNGTKGDKYLVRDRDTTASIDLKVAKAVDDVAKKAFFTFSEDSNGKYSLTEVKKANNVESSTLTNVEIKNGSATVGTVAVNRNTVFVVVNGNSYVAYTGNNTVPNITLNNTSDKTDTIAYVTKGGIATHVFVGELKETSVSGNTIFILSDKADRFAVEKDSKGNNVRVNYYKAIVDGEATEVKVQAKSATENDITGTAGVGAFTPTYNDDGVITALKATDVMKVLGYRINGGTMVGNEAYTVSDDTAIYQVDGDLNVDATTAGDLDGTSDPNDFVYVVANNNKVDYAVIFAKDNDNVGFKATYGSDTGLTFTDKKVNVQGVANTVLKITADDANAKVTFKSGSSTEFAAWTDQTPSVTTTYTVRITASDTVTVDEYTITVTFDAAG